MLAQRQHRRTAEKYPALMVLRTDWAITQKYSFLPLTQLAKNRHYTHHGLALRHLSVMAWFRQLGLYSKRACNAWPQKNEAEQFLIGRHSRRCRPSP